MVQLVWLCKIANSYKLDAQIFVWYNCWKIGCVLFLPTCMKEIDQLHFTFRNAELFWRKIYFNEWSWFAFWLEKKNGEDESAKRSKCWTAIWKSRHRHLRISIGIDVGIGIGIAKKVFFLTKFLFLPFEFSYEESIYGEVLFKYPCTSSWEFQPLFRLVTL